MREAVTNEDMDALLPYLVLSPASITSLQLSLARPTVCLKLLSKFTDLTTLNLTIDHIFSEILTASLPPSLTSVALEIGALVTLDLNPVLIALPNVTDLKLALSPSASTTWTIQYLPPNLKSLHFESKRGPRRTYPGQLPTYLLACPLPPSLTSLQSNARFDKKTVWKLDTLPSLTRLAATDAILNASESGDGFVLVSLPTSLVDLTMHQVTNPSRLSLVPKTLTRLACHLQFEEIDAPSFDGLVEWTKPALLEHMRQKHFPNISREKFHVQIVGGIPNLFTAMSQNGMTAIDVHSASAVLPAWEGQAWPTFLTYVSAPAYTIKSLSMTQLPPKLQVFHISSNIEWPQAPSLYAHALEPIHAFPQTLHTFGVAAPLVRPIKADAGSALYFYPPLETAPLLHTLILSELSSPQHLSALATLPDTITDLSIHWAEQLHRVVPEMSPEWLPNLRRFSLAGAIVPLRHFLPRLPTMTFFHAQQILVHADIVPPFPQELIELDAIALQRRCLQHLIPPHLRRITASFIIEWSPLSLSRLPSTLQRLELASKDLTNFTFKPLDLAAHLLPSLQHLDLGRYCVKHTFDQTPFPETLKSMWLTIHPTFGFDTNTLKSLVPDTLETMYLEVRTPFQDISNMNAIARALPRSLTRLTMERSMTFTAAPLSTLEEAFFSAFPPGLRHLCIKDSTATDYSLNGLRFLPSSVTDLSVLSDVWTLPSFPGELPWAGYSFFKRLHSVLPQVRHFSTNSFDAVYSGELNYFVVDEKQDQ